MLASLRHRLHEAFVRWALRARPPESAPIVLTQRRVYVLPTRAGLASAVALGVMAYAENTGASLEVARTLGFVTFSLTHVYAALSYRNPNKSIFTMETFNNMRLNGALLISLIAILLPTEVSFLQRNMALVSLDFELWLLCAALASVTLWVSEGYKLFAYRRQPEA